MQGLFVKGLFATCTLTKSPLFFSGIFSKTETKSVFRNSRMALATMRQLEERQVENEIKLMLWSPKMDIIAVGFVVGDVSLYRLNWQKLWTLSLPDPNYGSIEAFAWRPDGKILAVGYHGGQIALLDIESPTPIHRCALTSGISCLNWVQMAPNFPHTDEPDHWSFLTKFPSLSKAYSYNPSGSEETEDCRKVDDGSIVSLLIAGTVSGEISLYVNGFLLCANLNIGLVSKNPEKARIADVVVARDLKTYSVLCTVENRTKVVVVAMPLMSTCLDELATLSRKFSVLEGMTHYMSDTLKQISEAWEGILLEMDEKLASYASKLPDADSDFNSGSCGMAADFLELLTFGTPSPDLEAFLLQELTEKGLKKLGHSIEVSYSNVQRLVLKYLHTVSQSMNFHLCELLGLIKANEKYALMLGVTEANVAEAQKKAASFWSKGIELQQVIDESMKSFKAFFRWLYVEILKLSEEEINEEISKVSQQDVRYIADFLDSFAPDTDDDGQPHHKNLERVGQYLKDEPLPQPVDRSKNPWHQFLAENAELFKDVPFIVQANSERSLVQEFKALENAMNHLFKSMNFCVTDKCLSQGELCLETPTDGCCDQLETQGNVYGFVKLDDTGKLLFYRLDSSSKLTAVHLSFDKSTKMRHASASGPTFTPNGPVRLVDSQFYTNDILSLLIKEEGHDNQRLIQLSISDIELHLKTVPISAFALQQNDLTDDLKTVSVFEMAGQACHRELERIASVQFAVSVRKVAAFLFKNRKRVRIYDMDIEEEDADEDFDEENEIAGLSSSELNTSV